jgi:[ribosomal protein S5]-alanine N-acetyltransferase
MPPTRMDRTIFIETERLYLRQWQQTDEDLYIVMNQSKDVMEFFPATLTDEQSLAHIRKMSDHIHQYGYGLFAMETKKENIFIGFTGLSHPAFGSFFTPCTEIGWRLAKPYWNLGYATEAGKACLVFGFETLLLKEIYSFTSIHNTRSEQVMKKIGMQRVQTFKHPLLKEGHYLQEHLLYKISNTLKNEDHTNIRNQ